MKKWFFIMLTAYAAIAIILIFFCSPPNAYLSILSIKETRAELIASETDTFDLQFYLSDDQSFFTDQSNISSCRITSQDNEMVVDLVDILSPSGSLTYLGKKYYSFCFQFAFDQVSLDSGELMFPNASIVIVFQNQLEFSLDIGSIAIHFGDITPGIHFDMSRLYALMNSEGDEEYMGGIIIGFDAFALGELTIDKIEILVEGAYLDLDNAVILEDAIAYNTRIEDLLGSEEYHPVVEEWVDSATQIRLIGDQLLFIPIRYLQDIRCINRFPLFVHYSYLEEDYMYVIDDFLFFQKQPFTGVSPENVSECIHHY